MLRRLVSAITVATASLLTIACPQTYRVRLKPDSSRLTLLLDGSHPKPVDMVELTTCGQVNEDLSYREPRPVWTVYGDDLPDSTRLYREISYGQQLRGFRTSTAPALLSAGCYVATVVAAGASGSLHLWIDSLNRARPWTPKDHDSASVQYNKYAVLSNARADSAITLCLAAYHSATTADDSARIDHQVMNERVGPEPFTCRDYRRLYWSRFQKRPWSKDSTGGGA